nr:RNA-directed DNA polymerase, eukaryota [Tanacetum cinerariifolium]
MNTSAKTMGENNRGGDKSSHSFGGVMGSGNSYINVFKSSNGVGHLESHSPDIVLDDDCVISKELSYSLMGRVKEFALLTNLKTALLNEGFVNLSVRYLGELWVLLKFLSSKTKEAFRVNVGVSSWFSEIKQASLDIIPDGRIVWVEIIFQGKVFWIRAKEVPGWVPDLIEESEEEEQSDVDSLEGDNKMNEDDLCGDNMDMTDVPETVFDESNGQKKDVSHDPFGIYPMLNKKTNEKNDKDHIPKYPPGFTPNEETNVNSGIRNKSVNYNADEGTIGGDGVSVNVNAKGDDVDSTRLVDEAIDKGDGTEEVVNKRVEVLNSLRYIDQMHAMDLAQKAKIKWSIEGDENSSFFHGMLNKKRNQSNIRGIMVDGVWKEQPNDVKKEFLNHFQERFDKPVERRVTIDMTYPISISGEQRDELEREVTIEEIKMAVWNCGTDKSSGPNGFTFDFYRQFWSTIDKDVYAAVNHFFINGDIPAGCYSSFIALIPKVLNANLVKDFRPISLIGSIYKIIAKILTNRLINILGDIVSKVQSAFVAGRQILDGPFILNEVLHWCSKKKHKSLIFKVDFEKAYDSVRWDFLDDVLKKFGFGNKWCNWIQCCLKFSRGSILVNGSPTDEFQFYKGLKQGDPLILY